MSYKKLIMKKLISVFLVLGILNITFSGCTSSKLLSVEEASQIQPDKKYLILHDLHREYTLNNYEFADNKLKGELTRLSKIHGYNIHVYTSHNFDVKVDKNSSLYVELDRSEISKITYTKIKTGSTILLATGGILGIMFIIAVNSLDGYL